MLPYVTTGLLTHPVAGAAIQLSAAPIETERVCWTTWVPVMSPTSWNVVRWRSHGPSRVVAPSVTLVGLDAAIWFSLTTAPS